MYWWNFSTKFMLVEFSLCTTQLVRISHSTIFFQVPKILLSGDHHHLNSNTKQCAYHVQAVQLASSRLIRPPCTVCARTLCPYTLALFHPPCALMEKIPYLETGIPKGHNSAIFFALHYLVFSTLISSPFFGFSDDFET